MLNLSKSMGKYQEGPWTKVLHRWDIFPKQPEALQKYNRKFILFVLTLFSNQMVSLKILANNYNLPPCFNTVQ